MNLLTGGSGLKKTGHRDFRLDMRNRCERRGCIDFEDNFEDNILYLLANDVLISSANSFALSSVSLDFDTICLNLISFDSFSFNNLLTSIDSSTLDIVLNSASSSSGMDIVISDIINDIDKKYINVSDNKMGGLIFTNCC